MTKIATGFPDISKVLGCSFKKKALKLIISVKVSYFVEFPYAKQQNNILSLPRCLENSIWSPQIVFNFRELITWKWKDSKCKSSACGFHNVVFFGGWVFARYISLHLEQVKAVKGLFQIYVSEAQNNRWKEGLKICIFSPSAITFIKCFSYLRSIEKDERSLLLRVFNHSNTFWWTTLSLMISMRIFFLMIPPCYSPLPGLEKQTENSPKCKSILYDLPSGPIILSSAPDSICYSPLDIVLGFVPFLSPEPLGLFNCRCLNTRTKWLTWSSCSDVFLKYRAVLI